MKTRIKFRQMPGDVRKQEKIAMLEDRNHRFFGWLWKNKMQPRERAILKERAKQEIRETIE